MSEIITLCPVCKKKLSIEKLKCLNCGLELTNDFEISKYDLLQTEQKIFLETFLSCEGNLKEVQNELSISYPLAKKKLSNLLEALHLKKGNKGIMMFEEKNNIFETNTSAGIIVNKLLESGGCATYHTFDGTPHQVYIVNNGRQFASDALPQNLTYGFEIFDCVAEAISKNGGKVKKGDARSKKVGENNMDETTVAGYLAIHFFGKQNGESCLDPSFLLFGIMEWAGIINNCRGYVEFSDSYKKLLKID